MSEAPPSPPWGAPKTGPSSARLEPRTGVRQTAPVGAIPCWDRPPAPAAEGRKEKQSVNHQLKSVTDVLNLKCYLCIDCALANHQSPIRNQQSHALAKIPIPVFSHQFASPRQGCASLGKATQGPTKNSSASLACKASAFRFSACPRKFPAVKTVRVPFCESCAFLRLSPFSAASAFVGKLQSGNVWKNQETPALPNQRSQEMSGFVRKYQAIPHTAFTVRKYQEMSSPTPRKSPRLTDRSAARRRYRSCRRGLMSRKGLGRQHLSSRFSGDRHGVAERRSVEDAAG